MLTAVIGVIVLFITALAIWCSNKPGDYVTSLLLYVLATIGWMILGYLVINLAGPSTNTFIVYASAIFCWIITIVMAVLSYFVVNKILRSRRAPNYRERREAKKERIRQNSQPGSKKQWWEV